MAARKEAYWVELEAAMEGTAARKVEAAAWGKAEMMEVFGAEAGNSEPEEAMSEEVGNSELEEAMSEEAEKATVRMETAEAEVIVEEVMDLEVKVVREVKVEERVVVAVAKEGERVTGGQEGTMEAGKEVYWAEREVMQEAMVVKKVEASDWVKEEITEERKEKMVVHTVKARVEGMAGERRDWGWGVEVVQKADLAGVEEGRWAEVKRVEMEEIQAADYRVVEKEGMDSEVAGQEEEESLVVEEESSAGVKKGVLEVAVVEFGEMGVGELEVAEIRGEGKVVFQLETHIVVLKKLKCRKDLYLGRLKYKLPL